MTNDLKTVKLLRFLRLIRLMRLAKVKRVMERYESLLGLINTFEFVKLVVMVFFVGHILCCFWFLVGGNQVDADGTLVSGWIAQNGLENATSEEQYITSLYWSLTTMTTVGYGDISAYTTLEKVYAVLAMLIGGFAFGLIVGSLTNIISASNPAETLRKGRLSEIAAWMNMREVPQELREQVYMYYRTLLLHKVGVEERQLMRELPHCLAEPLMGRLYEKIMGSPEEPLGGLRCWKQLGMDELPHEDQLQVCTRMLPFDVIRYTKAKEKAKVKEDEMTKRQEDLEKHKKPRGAEPGDASPKANIQTKEELKAKMLDIRVALHTGYVYKQGEDDDRSIYFIRDGTMELLQEDPETHEVTSSILLSRGECFGQMCISWLNDEVESPRLFSARAVTDCSLFMLNHSALLQLQELCPGKLHRWFPIEQCCD